jgi:hypothetical protein
MANPNNHNPSAAVAYSVADQELKHPKSGYMYMYTDNQ